MQAEMLDQNYFYMVQGCSDCFICLLSLSRAVTCPGEHLVGTRATQTFCHRRAIKELLRIC